MPALNSKMLTYLENSEKHGFKKKLRNIVAKSQYHISGGFISFGVEEKAYEERVASA